MRVGLIVVTYASFPKQLIQSIGGTKHKVRWYVQHHGQNPALEEQLVKFAKVADVDLRLHRENRGLSRSWNEAIVTSAADGNELTLLLNDDLFFYDEAFESFLDFVTNSRNFALAIAHGFESRTGNVVQQGFACCAIGQRTIDEIGFFDENFTPAYFEDTDYARRIRLRNLPIVEDRRKLVEHDRSTTVRTSPEIQATYRRTFLTNKAYYVRKWGGEHGSERFVIPFDNPRFGLKIEWATRSTPYGEPYDRKNGIFADNLIHLLHLGDRWFATGEWAGERGSKLPIEGIMLAPWPELDDGEFEYLAVHGDGTLSKWMRPGEFCGSRGRSMPLRGLRLRILGTAARLYRLYCRATFVDGSTLGPLKGTDLTCQAHSGSALEAFDVRLEEVAYASPEVKTPETEFLTGQVNKVMAHPEQVEFCKAVKLNLPDFFSDKLVVDIGSLDINGNNQYLFEKCLYIGVDLAPGPNVDFICTGHELGLPDSSVDVIISTECFEHDQFYEKTLKNIVRMLKPGGLFMFTCATRGRPEHGTTRSHPENSPFTQNRGEWGDYYKNLEETDIRRALDVDEIFDIYAFSTNRHSHDLYFYGVKKGLLDARRNYSFQIRASTLSSDSPRTWESAARRCVGDVGPGRSMANELTNDTLATESDVIAAYRLILGRYPENEAVVRRHLATDRTVSQLREVFFRSTEFRRACAQLTGGQFLKPLSWEPISVETEVSNETLSRLYAHIEASWAHLGKSEPHFSVLTDERFKAENIVAHAEEFYRSGAAAVQALQNTAARAKIDLAVFRDCFELGCGVGRVTVKLAELFERVLAADISAPHLALAREAARERRLSNIEFIEVNSISAFDELPQFDVFYSVIVLQHNPPPVIGALLRKILAKLRAGGIAYFQVPTYGVDYQFTAETYLERFGSTLQMEMHVLPQNELFKLVNEMKCLPLEVREDGATGQQSWISNTFLLQKVK